MKERLTEAQMGAVIKTTFQDIRYAIRVLRKSPAFTAVAVAMVALGIGVNGAVFTIANATLFKGFPLVHDNDRLLYLTTNRGSVDYVDFEEWRMQAKSFQGMAFARGIFSTLDSQGGSPETYYTKQVTPNIFGMLGVKPILGRDFTTSDAVAGAEPTVILRYSLWEQRFGKDPAIIGQAMRLNGVPTTVIGVMPPGFSFPEDQSLWTPAIPPPDALRRGNFGAQYVFGRMADGATIQSVRAEMEIIGRRLANAQPRTNEDVVPVVKTFGEHFIGKNATTVYEALWGAVGFVLVIVCANLGNLLLARATGRSHEISVRLALGAGQWRIARQFLVESVMLSGFGGIFGWWVAKWSVRIYTLAASSSGGSGISDAIPGTSNVLDYSMDSRVIAYFIAISAGTGILFGLAPALRLSKLDVNTTMKDGGRGATGGSRGKRLSGLLVIGETALAVMLLAGAGVMIRSFLKVYDADVGVTTANVLTSNLYLSPDTYVTAESRISFVERLETHLQALPGVESVAISDAMPTEKAVRRHYELAGTPLTDERLKPTVPTVMVGPGYFRTLGAVVSSGREFDDFDHTSGIPVAIVNRQFAMQNWPGENPLGKRLRLFRREFSPEKGTPPAWLTVVGVVSDIVQNDATRREFSPLVYTPYRLEPGAAPWVLARTRVPPGSLADAFRREVQAIDPALPVPVLWPLAERLDRAIAFRRNFAVLFLAFGAIALLLASVGLYGVIAHAVSQRTQEIGIRIAIGATESDILRLVFRQGMMPLGIGLTMGLAASLPANRVLQSMLVQVSPSDPITLVVASGVLILSATLGCLIPARRAMRVDPFVALRNE